jgi:hypothetical protein
MKTWRIGFAVAVGSLAFVGLSRADSGFQAALWPPIQIVDEQENIGGVRLNIYGRNKDMSGVDFGFAHETTGEFMGVGIGLVNLVGGDGQGVQWGMHNRTTHDFYGWNSAAVSRVGNDFTGFQNGLVCLTGHDFYGLQMGFYDQTRGYTEGAQVGIINRGGEVAGFQLGLINIADKMYGLQIGLWNQINEKQSWRVIPLVNWNF